MTQQLSPIAQAVQFAAFRVYDEEEHLYVVSAEKHAGMIAAAALRAAADQVVIKLAGLGQESAWYLEEIATELEAQ
jgi:hypothetical protein